MTITEILTIFISLTSLTVAYLAYYNNSIADIVIYAKVDLDRPSLINLVIHNIGKGIAQNISIKSSAPIPKNAYGIERLTDRKEFFDSGIFLNGIPILFPNEQLKIDWGQYGGLLESLNNQPITFSISFYSKTNLQIFKRKIIREISIDISMFQNISIGQPTFQLEVKKSLQSISKSLEKISKNIQSK